jgi:hypothetical protein
VAELIGRSAMSALGQETDILTKSIDVRFAPESKHSPVRLECPLSAITDNLPPVSLGE